MAVELAAAVAAFAGASAIALVTKGEAVLIALFATAIAVLAGAVLTCSIPVRVPLACTAAAAAVWAAFAATSAASAAACD